VNEESAQPSAEASGGKRPDGAAAQGPAADGSPPGTGAGAGPRPRSRSVVLLALAAVLAVITAVFVVFAPDAPHAAQQQAASGTVAGLVVQGPMTPVDPGAGVAWPTVEAVVRVSKREGSTTVRTVRTGSDGSFSVILRPGIYRLIAHPAGISTLPIPHAVTLRVRAGRVTRVRLWLDTGLRFPIAAHVKRGTAPGGEQRYPQGIEGRTVRGPLSPVAKPNEPNSAPCPATLVVYRYDGHLMATVHSTAQSGFTASLKPGRYVIDPHSASPREAAAPFTIRVPRHRWLSLVVSFDTGIR
jgi:hypothetical protein